MPRSISWNIFYQIRHFVAPAVEDGGVVGGRISLKPGTYPCATIWPMRDGYEGVRVITEIFATTDVTDMADPDPAHWPHRVEYVYDAYNDVWKPANGLEYPRMFFRWRVDVVHVEE